MPSELGAEDAPLGLDRSHVRVIGARSVAAFVSDIDGAEYGADVAERATDREWIAPRAMAHDAVVTWASDRGSVVPLPMWVLFSSDSAVEKLLTEREHELAESLSQVANARELVVRVSAAPAALEAVAGALDPAIAAIENEASHASPGQAYLLKRRAAEARKVAVREAAGRLADECDAALAPLARAGAEIAVKGIEQSAAIFERAYLVDDARYDAFREALTKLVELRGRAGVRYDFTGPWPPYHFARGLA